MHIIALGLDGLSFKYISKIQKNRLMPNLIWLLNRAQKTTLNSEFPPITPTCWASILTGVNPGKHGIFSFERVNLKTLKVRLYNANDLMHPRIHEMLAMMNKKSIVINPIPEYPIIPAKGSHVISHLFFAPKLSFFPENLRRYAENLPSVAGLNAKKTKAIRHYCEIINAYVDLVDEIITEVEWDLFWINISFPDFMLHRFPQAFFDVLPVEREILAKIDKILGILLKHADLLFIVSDHGFAEFNCVISLADFLVENSFAKVGYDGFRIKEVRDFLQEQQGNGTKETLGAMKSIFKRWLTRLKRSKKAIDIRSSVAFTGSKHSCGIYVKHQEIISTIMEKLKQVDGIAWIKERNQVYNGPYVSRAPHILVCPDYDKGYTIEANVIHGKVIVKKKKIDHHPHGVFIMYAKDKAFTLNKLPDILPQRIITPLIMHIFGLPISKATDDTKLLQEITSDTLCLSSKYVLNWFSRRVKRYHVAK